MGSHRLQKGNFNIPHGGENRGRSLHRSQHGGPETGRAALHGADLVHDQQAVRPRQLNQKCVAVKGLQICRGVLIFAPAQQIVLRLPVPPGRGIEIDRRVSRLVRRFLDAAVAVQPETRAASRQQSVDKPRPVRFVAANHQRMHPMFSSGVHLCRPGDSGCQRVGSQSCRSLSMQSATSHSGESYRA